MAMDRRKEVMEAAAKGIREYLRSTRGAVACGPRADVTDHRGDQLVVTNSDGSQIFIGFMEV